MLTTISKYSRALKAGGCSVKM